MIEMARAAARGAAPRVSRAASAAALGTVLLAAAPAAKAEDYPAMSFNMAHFLPQTYGGAEWEQWWADELRKRSNGAIDVTIFWAGSLGGAMEILDLVGSGAVPLGVSAQGYFLSDLPVAGTAGNLMMRTHTGPADSLDTWRKFREDPEVQKELAEAGVVELTGQAANPYKLTCTKPVRTVDDIKGLRVRVPGSYMPEWWASLGAAPVSVPLAEQYEALQKGTIDCAYSPLDQIFSTKLDEVAKYAIDLSTGSHLTWNIFMNKDVWNGLPAPVQALMTEVSDDMMAELVAYNEALETRTIEETIPARGMTYVVFEEKERADAEALDTISLWVERLTAQGKGEAAKRLEPILREKRAAFHD